MKRRDFLKASLTGPLVASCGGSGAGPGRSPSPNPNPTPSPQPPPSGSVVFHVREVPDQPFTGAANHHAGVDALLQLMGRSGLVSMSDGGSTDRHYSGLGETCGRMIAAVRPPVLNVMDAIWVSHRALGGSPASATHRANQLLASQDPVALDYWSAKSVLYPVDSNPRHAPAYPGIDRWLTDCMNLVNSLGGIARPDEGIHVGLVTKYESEFQVVSGSVA